MIEGLAADFLTAFQDSLEWSDPKDYTDTIRRMCEEYQYAPNNHLFHRMAFGWFWGRCGDHIQANCEYSVLMLRMNEIYRQVAEENHWE